MNWLKVLACALVLGASAATAQTPNSADALMGMWESETVFASTLRGDLAVHRSGDAWRAEIGGQHTDFTVGADGVVRFDFNGHGSYRGALARNGTIEGFWVRPSGTTEDRADPGGSGQAFASPLILRRDGRNGWRGDVVPLDERFTLYLSVFRTPEGALMGAFRNPEINARGGASRFNVTRDGDKVTFLFAYEGGEARHEATLLHNPERLAVHWDDVGLDLELTRRTDAEAAAFFPRPLGSPAYVYQRPEQTGDGWRTARARDVGMDEAALAMAVQGIINSDPTARPPTLMHSMLVAHRGKLVLEEYFYGTSRDTPHDVRSAGKTFSAIMMGVAIREGVAISPNARIYDIMSARGPFANPDPRKAQITLAQLMSHSAGLACDDNKNGSPGAEGTMWEQHEESDWWKYTLNLPQEYDPGAHYAYCSANINLVGGALATATGVWLPQYFESRVARPLQFGRYYWNLSANGEGYLGGGAFIRPRDLLKIGQMYLDGGVWNGRRIVTPEWIAQSTAQQIEVSPATTGLSEEDFSNSYNRGADGLAWHLGVVHVGEQTYRQYQASGNGGQLIIVVPDFDLTVVFTGGNYAQGGVWSKWLDQVVGVQIILAIRERS